MRGLLDTSVFIAIEQGRTYRAEDLPGESVVSPVTVAELSVGVLSADEPDERFRRMVTLRSIDDIELLPIDAATAEAWSVLRVHLAATGRRANINDLWVAATGLANRIPVYTQDADFGPVSGVSGLEIIEI